MNGTVTVVNQGGEPLMLDDGTMVGAAHTPESRREGVTLSANDRRRYVETDSPRLLVIEQTPAAAARPRPDEEEQRVVDTPTKRLRAPGDDRRG